MKIQIIVASSLFALSGVGLACSSGDSGSISRPGFSGNHNGVTGTGDSGTQTGVGAGDAGSTAVDNDAEAPPGNLQCNYGDNNATPVTATNSGGSMPVGAGGAQPLDGEYYLTSVVHYGSGGSGGSYKSTAYLSNGTHQYVTSVNGAADTRTTISVEYEPDGSLLWTGKCGSTQTTTMHYSAPSETQLIVYDSTTNTAFTYDRPLPPDPNP